jgi:hypothetical protein
MIAQLENSTEIQDLRIALLAHLVISRIRQGVQFVFSALQVSPRIRQEALFASNAFQDSSLQMESIVLIVWQAHTAFLLEAVLAQIVNLVQLRL